MKDCSCVLFSVRFSLTLLFEIFFYFASSYRWEKILAEYVQYFKQTTNSVLLISPPTPDIDQLDFLLAEYGDNKK